MKRIILTAVATVAEKSAKKADRTISILGLYEPKQPMAVQKNNSAKQYAVEKKVVILLLTGGYEYEKNNYRYIVLSCIFDGV